MADSTTTWGGGSWSSVQVTQPPARAGRLSAKGLKGTERKEALALLGQHRALKKSAKGRVQQLNKQIKASKRRAGAHRAAGRWAKKDAAFARRVARHKSKLNAPLIKAQKAHLANLRAQIRGHKQAIIKSKKAIAQNRRAIKQHQKANGAAGRVRAGKRAFHQAKKATSWMWLLRQAKKAMSRGSRARRPDGRNHGMTGVRRKGVTGMAGR